MRKFLILSALVLSAIAVILSGERHTAAAPSLEFNPEYRLQDWDTDNTFIEIPSVTPLTPVQTPSQPVATVSPEKSAPAKATQSRQNSNSNSRPSRGFRLFRGRCLFGRCG